MKKSTVRNWFAGMLVLAALIGLAGLARGTAEPQKASPVQAETDFEEAHIQELRELLRDGQLSEAGRESVQAKLSMAERISAEREASQAAALAGPRVKSLPETMQIAPQAAVVQPIPEGIFEGSEGLVRPGLAAINNMWQGERGGSLYQVFAGALPDQPEQGLVIVVQVVGNRPTGDQYLYLAPQASGSLRIQAVDASTVLVESAAGQRMSFDLVDRSFSE